MRQSQNRKRTVGMFRQCLLGAISRKSQPRRRSAAAHIISREMQPFAVRHQLGHIAFLPLPTERLSLDRKIGGEKTQNSLHAGILASIGKPDAMPRMPLQQMRYVPWAWLIWPKSAGSIEHATSPSLEYIIVAVDEAEFWRPGAPHRRKYGIFLATLR
jgi:hypothetical protein